MGVGQVQDPVAVGRHGALLISMMRAPRRSMPRRHSPLVNHPRQSCERSAYDGAALYLTRSAAEAHLVKVARLKAIKLRCISTHAARCANFNETAPTSKRQDRMRWPRPVLVAAADDRRPGSAMS
jgi:hypothetical protein